MEGKKNDTGKLRFDLIPPDMLDSLAYVYTIGAAKYTDYNWLKGMAWSRILGALKRHLSAFEQGDIFDDVDGQEHLASVIWCATTLMVYEKYAIGEDDRFFKIVKKTKEGGIQ